MKNKMILCGKTLESCLLARARHGSLACLALFVSILLAAMPAAAQQKQRFSVANFELDQSSATGERNDSDGYPMALVKVTSNDSESLGEYAFNFGNQYSVVDSRDHGNELWLYVQRNAKRVNITRGNSSIEVELRPMVEAGKVYHMYIKGPERVMRFQAIRFSVTPQMAGARIYIKGSDTHEEFFGTTDATGSVAKNLRHNRYTYRVEADLYKDASGEFVLNDENSTHNERVTLLPNFSEVTLSVDADADIYVNNEYRGHKRWTGIMKAGDYQIECRQESHKPSREIITVAENDKRTFTLASPTPITGRLFVNSTPLDARITIDGRDYGTTPRNLDITIGQHRVEVSKQNYKTMKNTVKIKADDIVEWNCVLESTVKKQKEQKNAKVKQKKAKQNADTADKAPALSGFYAQLGYQTGSFSGVGVNAGGYIKNFNIEAFGCYGLDSETIFGLSSGGKDPVGAKLKPIVAGCRLGYGIAVTRKVLITPQAVTGIVMAKSDVADLNAVFAGVGVKGEYALTPAISLFLCPQYRIAVKKSNAYERISALSSKVKGWGTGFDCGIGISFNF